MKDSGFYEGYLKRWKDILSNAEVVKFPSAGYFVQEEKTEEAITHIYRFLECT